MKKVVLGISLMALIFLFTSCPGSTGDDLIPDIPHVPKVCVAWAEQDASAVYQVIVKCKEEGGALTQLGPSLNMNPANDAKNPSVAQDVYGWPYVAWEENNTIYAKHWNNLNQAWDSMGDVTAAPMIARSGVIQSAAIAGGAYDPSISVGGDNIVAVAYLDDNTLTSLLYVRQWDGSAWPQLGGSLNISATQHAYDPSAGVFIYGLMYVAWAEYNGSCNEIYVKAWNGSTWTQMPAGGSLNIIGTQHASNPALAVAGIGVPFVTFKEDGSVYTKYWDFVGSAWQTVGGKVNTLDSWTPPSLALDANGLPYVLWSENYNVFVKQWDGATWQALGGQLNTDPYTYQNALTILPSDTQPSGIPYAAWREFDTSSGSIIVKSWDGAAWQGGVNVKLDPTKDAYELDLSGR